MENKSRLAGLAFALTTVFSTGGHALSDAEYARLSAKDKQNHQLQGAINTPYKTVPWRSTELCMNVVAGAGLIFRSYSQNIVNWDAPAQSRLWRLYRHLAGKPIHRYGVTAAARVTLNAGTGLLGGEEILATIRYSLANPFFPALEEMLHSGIANYRPGFMISFHIDGRPDLNLFLMDSGGLDGFAERKNPLEIDFTHKVNRPQEWGVRLGAALTFDRVVTKVNEQELDAFAQLDSKGQPVLSPRVPDKLIFRARPEWALRFATIATQAIPNYRGGGVALSPLDDREILTRIADHFPYTFFDVSDGEKIVGKVEVTSPFRMSRHGDHYYSKHPGFTRLQ